MSRRPGGADRRLPRVVRPEQVEGPQLLLVHESGPDEEAHPVGGFHGEPAAAQEMKWPYRLWTSIDEPADPGGA